jgi:polyphosphate kinase
MVEKVKSEEIRYRSWDPNDPEGRDFLSMPKAVAPREVPEDAGLDHPFLYLNRELGWIDFNWRVLALAKDPRNPLLERVRFLAITAGNLDEFTQKRIGGLKRQEAAGVRTLSPDGRTPTEQLRLLSGAMHEMHGTMTRLWEDDLKPALHAQVGIDFYDYEDLPQVQKDALHEHFQNRIYPILTPLAVDPGRPFPFISNLSLSLAIVVRADGHETTRFARLKVPSSLDRWLSLGAITEKEDEFRFVPVEQLIAHYAGELFQGMKVVGVYPFRVTRNADLRRDEEEADDLLAMISEELRRRRFAPVVRLEVAKTMPHEIRYFLLRRLDIQREDVYEVDGLLDLTGCYQIADLDLPKFHYRPWKPVVPARLHIEPKSDCPQDIFSIIEQDDLLVHHPYDSFAGSVQRLIEQAARDERVLAIKQTIYRTSDESPIVKALIEAADNGKQVAVLVEVKARFDEANNIEWGQMMEDAGIHVAYGLVGLKTHAKATLIVRQERDGLRTYCHIGTGNYHPKTAHLYTDLGLLTCHPVVGRDLINLFHYLTGYSPDQAYNKAVVAPRDMRTTFNTLIDQEIEYQRIHGDGHILAKMNALDDTDVIQRLYRASRAGVRIDLIVRGHCRLRPQFPGYSDNIRVVSILGRFLEHERIFYFGNHGDPLMLIGSADWRGRNLNERVELAIPVEDPSLKTRLCEILRLCLNDNTLAWDLDMHGAYTRRIPGEDEGALNVHKILMRRAIARSLLPVETIATSLSPSPT